jgi:hypothetical protein
VAVINHYDRLADSISLRHGDEIVIVPDWKKHLPDWGKPATPSAPKEPKPFTLPPDIPQPDGSPGVSLRPLGVHEFNIQLGGGQTLHPVHVYLRSNEHLDRIVAALSKLSRDPQYKLPENFIVSMPRSGMDAVQTRAKLTNLPDTTLISLITV